MFSATKDAVNTAKDNLANEGGPAVHDIKETARRFKGDARETASALKGDLEDVARKTGRQARDMANAATKNASDMADSMSAKIRSNPVQSSVIALAVGFVVGMLYRR
ncbi:MAG: hypothetical protein M3N08_07340 [Pseudomonadota bacterium]|nr:hypothetical protein [Pseudomonadota bacterium]